MRDQEEAAQVVQQAYREHALAMQERARSTALESMRRRRSSARTGRRSNVVQPEGMAAATPWAFHEYESYKYALDDRCDVSWASSDPSLLWHRYDGEESRIHFERRMDLDKRYRFKFHAVVLLLVGLIGVGIAIIAASQIIAAALLLWLLSALLCFAGYRYLRASLRAPLSCCRPAAPAQPAAGTRTF